MKTYILVNLFNNKPIYFTTYIDENHKCANTSLDGEGNVVIDQQNALCIEIDFDPSLLTKTYDPSTGTFS